MSGRAALVVAAALTIGCDAGGRDRPPAAIEPEDVPFSRQVAAVRERRTDRIVAGVPPTGLEWEALRGLAGLRELVLQRGVADDGRAAILASLPDLERLVLRQSPLSDEGFRQLAACPMLRDLNVPQAACTAAGIRSLAALGNLERLRIGGPDLAGIEVARALAALPRLRSLHLIDTAIGDEGLAALADLPELVNLYLDGAGVSDAAWERYFEARPDVHVHVDQAHHDRDPHRGHDRPAQGR